MSKDPSIKNDSSLYPEMDMEDVDENGWQISYLDIITILLGFLIILLSISHFSDHEIFSVSGLFKSSSAEAKYITTPVNLIKRDMNLALLDEVAKGELEIERDLNDLLIRFSTDELYLSGSATLQSGALSLLNEVVYAIKRNRYDDFKIDVEGHTDDVPISSPAYPSNWELSTARATNIVKFLTGMGIPSERLKASGYGSSRPLVPNVDTNGNPIPENRAKNRRVALRLYYTSADSTAIVNARHRNETVSAFNEICQYTVQLGGFQSFSNALSKAREAINKTDIDFDITYNGHLFSVRSKTQDQISESLNEFQTISQNYPGQLAPVIHQCYQNPQDRPTPLQYMIQMGAFQNRQNALAFTSDLIEDHKVSANIKTGSSQIYKVVSKPFTSLKAALKQLNYLKNQDIGANSFLTFSDITSTPYKFNFQLQIGSYSKLNKASEISEKVSTLMGLHTTIKEVENDTYIIVSEEFADWDRTVQTFTDLTNTSYNLSPVIYLLEYQ